MHRPERVVYPNVMPYSKAKRFYNDTQVLPSPDLDDFIGMLNFYSEVEFYHDGKKYGLLLIIDNDKNEKLLSFYQWGDLESVQDYRSDDDFRENAHINGKLLKDIWDEIENIDYM